ncbi:MAG: hypothetical protein ABEK17_02650 [Candidatus Aenigmatarchaeota archaeon]
MGRKKGLAPSPNLIILLIVAPLLLSLVFFMVPIAERLLGGAIGVEVNIKRMYNPLLSENTLNTLMHSQIGNVNTMDCVKYFLYYEGDFTSGGKKINTTLESYLDEMFINREYLLILNTTTYEDRIYTSNGKDLKPHNSYVSKINFRLPDLSKGRAELRLYRPE